jgi:hypothetical protein
MIMLEGKGLASDLQGFYCRAMSFWLGKEREEVLGKA